MFKSIKYCFLFLLLCSLNANAIPRHKLIDLGLQDSDGSSVYSINDKNQILGSFYLHREGLCDIEHYFIWEENQGIHLIDLPQGVIPKKFNNKGQISGEYYDSKKTLRGFFWDSEVGFIDIGDLGGSTTSVADMNDHGQIVGNSETNIPFFHNGVGNTSHAYLWENGNMIDLGTLVGVLGLPGNCSKAVGINNHEQIIGKSDKFIEFHKGKLMHKSKAVIWENRNIQDFDSNFDGETCLFYVTDSSYITGSKFSAASGGMGFIIDLVTRQAIPGKHISFRQKPSRYTKINNNGDCCLGIDLSNFKNENWKSFDLIDFNNNNWITGTAINSYDEQHAVAFIPINNNEEQEIPTESEKHRSELEDLKELQGILIKYGNNSEGLTPFHYAIKNGDTRAVEIMLNHGVDINLIDCGYTPLHQAIVSNHLETADLLIRYGANVNAYDEEGYTPLHRAIIANNFELVTFLLQHGANKDSVVKNGLAEFRCIDLARQYSSPDLSMLFFNKNVLFIEEKCRQHIMEANIKNVSPIVLAFQKLDMELAEYLLQLRERDLVLKKPTFEFPGYEFVRSFMQDRYKPHVWGKPVPIKIKGGNGTYVEVRVDVESIKLLIKYDSSNTWKKYMPEWLSKSYHLGDLETINFLMHLAKKSNIRIDYDQRGNRYLIDPFLSDIPIDRENPSHFYITGVYTKLYKTPPSLFEYRSDDNARIKELKRQIQELLNTNS
jgi:probable HAF family extracellular repeat protein